MAGSVSIAGVLLRTMAVLPSRRHALDIIILVHPPRDKNTISDKEVDSNDANARKNANGGAPYEGRAPPADEPGAVRAEQEEKGEGKQQRGCEEADEEVKGGVLVAKVEFRGSRRRVVGLDVVADFDSGGRSVLLQGSVARRRR